MRAEVEQVANLKEDRVVQVCDLCGGNAGCHTNWDNQCKSHLQSLVYTSQICTGKGMTWCPSQTPTPAQTAQYW